MKDDSVISGICNIVEYHNTIIKYNNYYKYN